MAVAAPRIRRKRASGAQPVSIGPFAGGLNTATPQDSIAENEVAELVNLEVDLDGSLVTRPPIARDSQFSGSYHHKILGYGVRTDGTTFVVVTFPEAQTTWVLNLTTNAWQQITGYGATGMVQYDNKIVLSWYLGPGGYWDMDSGVYTSMGAMPPAQGIVFFLGRFWAFGPTNNALNTRLYWSKLSVPGVSSVYDWAPASDYITVGAGDGQQIVGLIADPSGLIILKSASTYRFSYASGPTTGTLQTLSTTVGADSSDAFAPVENYYVVFCAGTLYQMLQGKYYPLSKRKIAFQGLNLENLQFVYSTAVSVFADRVMVWYYGQLYCYNLITQTWSTWFSYDAYPALFFALPSTYTKSGPRAAFVVTGVLEATRRRLYRVTEARTGLTENTPYGWRLTTRSYDFGAPFDYKRLMLWAVNIATGRPVHALAYAPTPVQGPIEEDDNTGSVSRRRLRVRAAFRFLQAYFQLSGTVDGSSATRLYNVIPYLSVQADMSAKEA